MIGAQRISSPDFSTTQPPVLPHDHSARVGLVRARAQWRKAFPVLVAITQVAGSYIIAQRLPEQTYFPWKVFFQNMFLTSFVFHMLLLAFLCCSLRSPRLLRTISGVVALSTAISLMLAADAVQRSKSSSDVAPDSFAGLIYTMVTERQALLILSMFSALTTAVAAYYVFRALFSVEYTGSGIQVKLPGQVVYYFPIYPQVSWQNTGIRLQEGEKFCVELSGYVSPGALQEISNLQNHMKDFVERQKDRQLPEEWAGVAQAPTWPYTPPSGYLEEWYGPERKLEVLRNHPIYGGNYYFKHDNLLTVKGLTHNKVVGLIRSDGEEEPRVAVGQQRAYDWNLQEDRDQLILLSSNKYPLNFKAKKSGELWVVINDVDVARWDNGGMFFMKVVLNSWL